MANLMQALGRRAAGAGLAARAAVTLAITGLASVAAPLAAAQAAAPAAPGTAAEVGLDFAWPDGLRAEVTQTKHRTRERSGQTTQAHTVTSAYEMTSRRAGAELRVSYGKLRVVGEVEGLSAAQRNQLELMARTSLPSLVVNAAGEFVRVHELAAFQVSIRRTLDELLKSLPDRDTARRAVDMATQESMLQALAAQDWNLVVGTWAGARLEPGETYTAEEQASLPMLPGVRLPMVSTYRVVGQVACTRGGVERRCVDLEMITEPEPKALATALEQMIARMSAGVRPGQAPPDGSFDQVEMKTVVRLRTEPAGLVPHQLSVSKTVRMTAFEKGQKVTGGQVEETRTSYRY